MFFAVEKQHEHMPEMLIHVLAEAVRSAHGCRMFILGIHRELDKVWSLFPVIDACEIMKDLFELDRRDR